jgi:5-methylcytosine-specific restriction endonuclease McrA
MRPVLLLNRSEEVLDIISWQRAIILLIQGKAKCPWTDVEVHEIKTVGGVFQLPSVLILVQYIKLPFKRASATRENVLKRDNHQCQYCGRSVNMSTGTVDHVVPVSRGGRHEWTNVAAACWKCNNKKDNLTAIEFEKQYGLKLRRKPFVPTRTALFLGAIDLNTHATWSRWVKLYD